MTEWGFWYIPKNHAFTKLFVTIKANSYRAAEMKFYAKYDDDCLDLIYVEKLK